jgi:hypothetical protein
MKTLKTLILGLSLMVVCSAVKADVPDAVKLTKTHAINTYLDAMTRGRLNGLNEVLDHSAKFSMLRGKSIMSFTKKEMTDYLKNQKNIEQVCTTSTEVVESNTDMAVIKVDMKFEDFVRSNYVTMVDTGNGWKITNVYSVFK